MPIAIRPALFLLWLACASVFVVKAEPKITHSFLATGAETRIISGDGTVA